MKSELYYKDELIKKLRSEMDENYIRYRKEIDFLTSKLD